MDSLIHGWGINDAPYTVEVKRIETVGNARKMHYDFVCPLYRRWKEMLRRCLSVSHQAKHPTYAGVRVCDEWQSFSVFREWMVAQPWEGNEIDKDILGDGTLYSPESCCFVPKEVNLFLTNCRPVQDQLLGASFDKVNRKYRAQGLRGGKRYTIGVFDSQEQAHLAWFKYKLSALDALLERNPMSVEIQNALRQKTMALKQIKESE